MNAIRKRIMLGVWILILLLVGFLYILIERAAPLHVMGQTVYEGLGDHQVLIEVINEGYTGITVSAVTVNGGGSPLKAKLGISHSSQLVLGQLKHADIEFVGLEQARIQPRTDENRYKLNYGLRIVHTAPVVSIEIHYSYLGLKRSIVYEVL
ncbi:hypothetical protein [Marinicrinis sediminis]|uniref:DUF4426 domain-containing protein n=1 Tax=Marinicrinis sediminis TaxID=1652465 RepID=A0ABW5RAN8_9BACL